MRGTEKIFCSYQCPIKYIGSLDWVKVSHQLNTEFHEYCGNVIFEAGMREA